VSVDVELFINRCVGGAADPELQRAAMKAVCNPRPAQALSVRLEYIADKAREC
jgi:hypothetical protein